VAVRDDNLMCLLLAYSASHRARLLHYKEPTTRIAVWVQDVFPSLRHALNDPSKKISNTTIATAIMLASLDIIAPNTFSGDDGAGPGWQDHLNLARRIIAERGRVVNRKEEDTPDPGSEGGRKKDLVSYFLMRWFAYLDLVSTLMSRPGARNAKATIPNPDGTGTGSTAELYRPSYWPSFVSDEDDFRIDCLLGFTSRLVSLLARIADLARRCDAQRIDLATGILAEEWSPPPDTFAAGMALKRELLEAREHPFKGCPHARRTSVIPIFPPVTPPTVNAFNSAMNGNNLLNCGFPDIASMVFDSTSASDMYPDDETELCLTNRAFHSAALIHLNRRILGLAQSDPEVQQPADEIVETLRRLRPGGTAETGFLFPIFTAGVEVLNPERRKLVLARVKGVEGGGMVQVCLFSTRLLARCVVSTVSFHHGVGLSADAHCFCAMSAPRLVRSTHSYVVRLSVRARGISTVRVLGPKALQTCSLIPEPFLAVCNHDSLMRGCQIPISCPAHTICDREGPFSSSMLPSLSFAVVLPYALDPSRLAIPNRNIRCLTHELHYRSIKRGT